MKICNICNISKDNEHFYQGHARCKDCYIQLVKEHRLKNREHYVKYDNQRAKLPHRIENAKKVIARWNVNHPERRKANILLCNAVRDGRAIKQPCFVCGDLIVDGHHCDYSRPLDVVWLCKHHHKLTHAMLSDNSLTNAHF